MRFTLIYDGPLESAGNRPKPDEKWAIRKQLDPQLRRLWSVNPDLANLKASGPIREDGEYIRIEPHHEAQVSVAASKSISSLTPVFVDAFRAPSPVRWVDLCEPIQKGGRSFMPLVRGSLALTCGLRIQFLKQESRGRVYQGGDLDGRIKLLLDALSVPQNDNEIRSDAGTDYRSTASSRMTASSRRSMSRASNSCPRQAMIQNLSVWSSVST